MLQFIRSEGCSPFKSSPRKLSQSQVCHILYSKAVIKPILIQRERGINPTSQQETWIWSQHYQTLPTASASFSLHHKGLMGVSSSGSDLYTCTCPRPWNIIILMLGVRKRHRSTVLVGHLQCFHFTANLQGWESYYKEKKSKRAGFDHWQSSNVHIYCMCFNVFWVKKKKYH